MLNKNSDYALNKKNPTAIVCVSVTGDNIKLVREQFESEEEFLFWKQWSDNDYQEIELRSRRAHDDYVIPLNEDIDAPSEPLEDAFISAIENAEREKERTEQMAQIQDILTETQFRRLWKYHAMEMSEHEIADTEGVGQQRISNSITGAQKKIEKNFGFASKKGGKNG